MKSEEAKKNKLYNSGLNSFKNKQFYQAHEFWEELWIEHKLSDSKFIQGLIQLSVAYFHITNLNKKGAISLFKKCSVKLKLFTPCHRKINVSNILRKIQMSLDLLSKIDDMKEFDWSLVPKLED
tara:strand:- start:33085 stop:33456 length:372 start_codon:yes stop_codon:yes gene_type:complete